MAIRKFDGNDMENVAGGVEFHMRDRDSGLYYVYLENDIDKNAFIQYLNSRNYSKKSEIRNKMTKEEYVNDYRKRVFSPESIGKRVLLLFTPKEYEEFKEYCKSNPSFASEVRFKE